MRRVLLINKDDSFKVMSLKEYSDYLMTVGTRVVKGIFRDSFSSLSEQKYCVFDMDYSTPQTRIWYSATLSEFPDEIKALIVLYKI